MSADSAALHISGTVTDAGAVGPGGIEVSLRAADRLRQRPHPTATYTISVGAGD